MKLWQRLLFTILNFFILGAIFLRPDFSTPVSVPSLILNWFVRLLVAIGFTAISFLLSHILKAGTAESYQLIDRAIPDSDPGLGNDETASFEEVPPRNSRSRLWSPPNLIFIAVCVAIVSTQVHFEILCKIMFLAIAVFLWMPNPWQGSANQPEKYEIAPRRLPR